MKHLWLCFGGKPAPIKVGFTDLIESQLENNQKSFKIDTIILYH